MKPLITILLLALALSLNAIPGSAESRKADPVTAPYHENALYNFHLGRIYMSQGRYELARERYLLALACSRNDEMRLRAAEELEAAQRQIESQR